MFKAFYGREGIVSYAPRTGAELQAIFSTLGPREAEALLAREHDVQGSPAGTDIRVDAGLSRAAA